MSEVTVGQAAKTAEVPVEVLRDLCDSGQVTAHRSDRGHWYLHEDDIPTRTWVVDTLRQRYRTQLETARGAATRLAAEVESVQLDLAEAADDAHATGVLGNDLSSFGDIGGAFNEARGAVFAALLSLGLTHRYLQAIAGQADT